MKNKSFNIFITLLYLASIVAIIYFAYEGLDYYLSDLKDRPHNPQHRDLKPGGLWGHGFGIIGSSFVILLFLYSARKRFLFGLRFGNIRKWLNIHIFFGIIGPLLITLHTAGKLHGLVSVSYFSMLAVMFSGILGRYIYIQIPRDEEGHELALGAVEEKNLELSNLLVKEFDVPIDVMEKVNQMTEVNFHDEKNRLSAMFQIMIDDIKRPFRFWKLKSFIKRTHPEFPPKAIKRIISFSKRKSLLHRRKVFLGAVTNVFHLWHVVHKPFAWIMFLIMFVHVGITVLMGYRWVF